MSKLKGIPPAEFVPWTVAHFHTELIRARFLLLVAATLQGDVEVKPMLDEVRGALVRWRPGKFLGLNDIAHGLGGRIRSMRRGGA